VISSATTDAWEGEYALIASEWAALGLATSRVDADAWEANFIALGREHEALVGSGQWLSGPQDLISVIGRRDKELTHSAAVAWLLNPTSRHGLGDRVLRTMCMVAWPEMEIPDGPFRIRREIERVSGGMQARADIVVWAGDVIIVIENKVWADEGDIQAERLYRVWVDEAADVRWLLLSPRGGPPRQITTAEARGAWRSLAYPRLAGMVSDAISDAPPPVTLGRQSAIQYLATLRSMFGPADFDARST